MNYYDEIKDELISNEINRKVKNYSINRSDLSAYYNVGKLLSEAGKCYGDGIIKEYSKKLTEELGKGYTVSNLKRFRQFYILVEKGATLWHQLSWSHYRELIPLNDINKINYYIIQISKRNLSKRQLIEIIKSNEYERLDDETKNNPTAYPDQEVLDKSDVFLNLPPKVLKIYEDAWTEIKSQ